VLSRAGKPSLTRAALNFVNEKILKSTTFDITYIDVHHGTSKYWSEEAKEEVVSSCAGLYGLIFLT
jgi:hypothetical protein